MPEDVKVPGLGQVDKKYVIAGVVVGAGIAVVVYVRGRNKASTAATPATDTSTSGAVTDPAGNTCAVLDPNSGYCPGTPEDIAYQESVTGNYSGLGYDGTGISTAGLPVDNSGGSSGGTVGTTSTPPSSVTTNTDWINEALGVVPGDTATIQTALASVLGGLTVTQAQKNLFEEAVGIIGPPPQGYPTPIKTSDTAGQPGSSGSNYAANPPKNLKLIHGGTTGVAVGWDAVPRATSYTVYLIGHGKSNTDKTYENIGSLKAGTKYTVEVWANPTPSGGPHATLNFTTDKLWP